MFRKTPQQKHFADKILITHKKMWDLEFLREKMRMMREGFRMEYDRLREQVDAATHRLDVENAKEDKDATIQANLQRLIDRYTPDIEQLQKQMEAIDSQIEGPEGVNENIDGLKTVIGLLEEYRKTI